MRGANQYRSAVNQFVLEFVRQFIIIFVIVFWVAAGPDPITPAADL